MRAWSSRASCRTADSREAWLATIAGREALRVAATRLTMPIDGRPEPTRPSHEGNTLERVVVHQALARLSPQDRSLLFARD